MSLVCHAEMNAILNKIVGKLSGCKIYVALFPCNECAKLIIQSGIKHVRNGCCRIMGIVKTDLINSLKGVLLLGQKLGQG